MKKSRLFIMVSLAGTMACSSVSAYESLERGSRGDEVVTLQQALIDQEYLNGAADGIFGGMTQDAISRFQEASTLEVTGVADDLTQKVLYGDVLIGFHGTWYFTGYEGQGYISTPDRQKLHVKLEITDDKLSMNIDKDGEKSVIDTKYRLNDDGISFTIKDDATYKMIKDENYDICMFGGGEEAMFSGDKYTFGLAEVSDPEIGANPVYWWEGDWTIYNVYDRDKTENEIAEGSISFGPYLETDINYAEIVLPDGTEMNCTYEVSSETSNLVLKNGDNSINVTKESKGYGSFIIGGCNYYFAKNTDDTDKIIDEENQIIARSVYIYDIDTNKYIACGDPVSVSSGNIPEQLTEEKIPQMITCGADTYVYDETCGPAEYNPEQEGYEVYMKLCF